MTRDGFPRGVSYRPRQRKVGKHPAPALAAPYSSAAPPLTLLVKLGSIAVHAEEMTEPGAHDFDLIALRGLLSDPEVVAWRKAMDASGFLPKKRSDRS